MSIVRFGVAGSDVYAYYSVGGGIDCCMCLLNPETDFNTHSRAAMLVHFEAHRAAGHHVPDFAIERLREEADVFGDDADSDKPLAKGEA